MRETTVLEIKRNAEKVGEWKAAKQAFIASDRVAFGTKLECICF